MEGLFIFLIAATLVMLVGHGLWVLVAWFFRTLSGRPAAVPSRREREWEPDSCAQCGNSLESWHDRCPACGLNRRSSTAGLLRDLTVATRQILLLKEAGQLDAVTFEHVQKCLLARREMILGVGRPKPVEAIPEVLPVLAVEEAVPESTPQPVPLAQQLAQFLEVCQDVRDLAAGQTKRVVDWYHRVDEDGLAALSPRSQWTLARVLARTGQNQDALTSYRRLLTANPTDPTLAEAALEAFRLARERRREADAKWFYEQILARSPASAPEALAASGTGISACAEPAQAEMPVPPETSPAPPRPPRRSLAEVLGAFMQQSNIVWGELIAGLIMVGSSVALVISLWTTLEQVPYFPFLIFTAITVAVFGAGLYTLSHWKLESTSRGLLVIATLLVPLNFLVMAGLLVQRGGAGEGIDFFRLASETAALAAFAYLLGKAGQVLVPGGRWLLVLAVLGISAGTLASPRLLGEERTEQWRSLAAGLLPVACYVVGAGGMLLRRPRPADAPRAQELLAFLGMATFPLVLALGFLIYWSQDVGLDIRESLQRLALLLAAAGVPLLAGGLVVQGVGGTAPDRGLGTLRTAGTAVALGGMAVLLAAVPLAWPDPWVTALVCGLNFLVLTAVAFRSNLPLAHAAALPCLAAGYVTIYHHLAGSLPAGTAGEQLAAVLWSARTGVALFWLASSLGVAAELLALRKYQSHAVGYATGDGVMTLVSLALLNAHGVEIPGLTAVFTGLYALGWLAANRRWRRAAIDYAALALVPLATAWALYWTWHAFSPYWAMVLAAEALALAVVAVAGADRLRTPAAWRHTALGVAFVAGGMAAAAVGMTPTEAPAGTLGLLALTFFVLARAYDRVALTWVGSALLLGCFLHVSVWHATRSQTPQPSSVAILTHASLVLLGGLLLRRFSAPEGWHNRLYARPLPWTALASSLLAPVFFALETEGRFGPLAGYTAWLAAVWLVCAAMTGSALLFAAFQAAVSGSVLFAVTAWLQTQPWVRQWPDDLLDPRALQAYGLGLAGLSIAWLAGRFAFRRNALAQRLLEPGVPAFDWVVLGLLVLAQAGLATWAVVPSVARELAPADVAINWPAAAGHAFGAGAWLLLGALTVALVLALWERQQRAAVFGLVLMAVTAAVLVGGPFAAENAAASALRWGLAGCLILASAPLWWRAPLGRLAVRVGLGTDLDEHAAVEIRRLLVALTAVPTVVLTTVAAVAALAGPLPAGFAAGSFFARVGPVAAHVVPLVLVALAFVGHGVRERTAGYTFSAGLVVNLAVTAGYMLGVLTAGQAFGIPEWVRLLQLATVTAAAWMAVGLVLSARYSILGTQQQSFLSLQVFLTALGNTLLLTFGVALLVAFFPSPMPWSVEVGAPLGWLALGLSIAATAFGRRLHPYSFGLLCLAAIGLAACTVLSWQPAAAYRTLLLGWAAFLPALVATAWWFSGWPGLSPRSPGASTASTYRGIEDSAPATQGALAPPVVAFWVRLTGIAVVLLAINAAITHHDHLWAAAALTLAGTAGATMAVWRRREDWAFLAGLAVILAASLVVWHVRFDVPFETWWLLLVQLNVLSAALVALLWLGARRLLYDPGELSLHAGPLLATQIALAFGGNALLLFWPGLQIVLTPDALLPAGLDPISSPIGWLALVLTAAAAFIHAGQVAPGQRGHVLLFTGLLAGVLAACGAAVGDPGRTWLGYHVLLGAWTGLGLVLVAAEPVSRLQGGELAAFSPFPHVAALLNLGVTAFRAWLHAVGFLVLVLALRAAGDDPQRPYWSAGATLAVAAMAGAVAVRARSTGHVYLSGLLVPLAGSLVWAAWSDRVPMPAAYSLGYTLALCLAAAAAVWSLVELVLRSGTPPVTFRGRAPAFAHAAAWLAVALGGVLVAVTLGGDLAHAGIGVHGLLPVAMLAATAVAFLACLWDAEAPLPLAGLYAVGLLAVGLRLHAKAWAPDRQAWSAGLFLAGYVFVTALLARFLPLLDDWWRALRLAKRPAWPEPWFLAAQSVVGVVVVGLSLWVVLTFGSARDRACGPISVLVLVAAGVTLAKDAPGRWAEQLRGATLTLAPLLAVEAGWTALDPAGVAVALHRNVFLLLALAAMTLLQGVALPRLARRVEPWAAAGRRAGPVLLAVTMVVLVGVLGHEFLHFDKETKHTPLVLWETAAVGVALVGLMAAGLRFAVAPATDPYRLAEARRPLYVYAAELLLFFLFVHVRLNVPELFGGALTKFWPLVVMGIAFVGVGLSEYFERRGLRVLAGPLQRTGVFLPLLPLLAFWARPPQAVHDTLVQHFPGLQPGLDSLMKLEPNFGRYAVLWFGLGLLYSWVASIQRSFRFALFAALAANFGLWALLFHADFAFLSHPQLWLIPLALILLASEHVNRRDLGPRKSAALRYLGLLMLYVSSTADMFLAWGANPYLPLVLAVLAIGGVFAGILLRVRAFLYLGTSFLFVVVFSMIWHAAVDGRQMWLWWASGIVLGALIFALFAVFEKRREDVLRVIEEIKGWE